MPQPAAIHFKRRARRWLEWLQRRAALAGIVPVRGGGAALDVVDALRSELLLRNGRALADLALARALRERHPGKKLAGDGGAVEPGLLAILARWGCVNGVAAPGPGLAARCRAACRRLAYRLKELWQEHAIAGGTRPGRLPAAPLLAFPRMFDQLADMLPVARSLRDDFQVPVLFALFSRRFLPALRREGFAYTPLYRLTGACRDFRKQQGGQLARLQAWLGGLQDGPAEFDAEELGELAESTARVFTALLAAVLRTADAFTALYQRWQPRGVLVGNPYTMEGRVAALLARGRGLPTATIQHGNVFADDPNWTACPVDLVCAWGEVSKRCLVASGVAEERIALTGWPRLDGVAAGQGGDRRRAPHMLVATSGPGDNVSMEQHRAFIRLLHEAAEATPEIRWLVKLHRKDRAELYRLSAQAGTGRLRVVPSCPSRDGLEIFDYLRLARGLITICSTTAVDALAVGVPVIAVDVWSSGAGIAGLEYLERGCCRRVRTAEELAAAARQLWRRELAPAIDAATNQYLAEHFANRGRASRAVAERLLGLQVSPCP